MALTETVLTGRFPFADDVVPASAVAKFVLSGVDVEGGDVVLPDERRVALTAGALPGGFALWSNGAGGRGTHYEVTVEIIQPAYFGPLNTTTAIPVGFLVVPAAGGPYAVADLLVWTPPGPTAVDVLALAQAAAVAATAQAAVSTGAAADALASATAAALYDGPRVDTFAQLVALTAANVAVGQYVQVRETGVWYLRVASGGDLTHTASTLAFSVMPVGDTYALEWFGVTLAMSAANVAATVTEAIAKLSPGQHLVQIGAEYVTDDITSAHTVQNATINLRLKSSGVVTSGNVVRLDNKTGCTLNISIDGDDCDANLLRVQASPRAIIPRSAILKNAYGTTIQVAALFARDSADMTILPTVSSIGSNGFLPSRGVFISDQTISENRSIVSPIIDGITIFDGPWDATGATAARAGYDAEAVGFNFFDTTTGVGYRRTGSAGTWYTLYDDADGVYSENSLVGDQIGGLIVTNGIYNNCQKRPIKISTNNPTITNNRGVNTGTSRQYAFVSSYRPNAGTITGNRFSCATGALAHIDIGGAAFGSDVSAFVDDNYCASVNDGGLFALNSKAVLLNVTAENVVIGSGNRFIGAQKLVRQDSGYTASTNQRLIIGALFFDKLTHTGVPAVEVFGNYDVLRLDGTHLLATGGTAGFYVVSAPQVTAQTVIEILGVNHGYSDFVQSSTPRTATDQRTGTLNAWRYENGFKIYRRNAIPTTLAHVVGDRVERHTPAIFAPSGWVCTVAGTPGTWTPVAGTTGTTFAASNVTTDRTYDANATTLDEIADVLGTLIADLRAAGVLN